MTEMTRGPEATGRRDDRLLAPTKWTAEGIIPVLIAAFVILYLFPGDTQRLWGWTVRPEMSALVMGAGYLAGAYLFTRVALSREWHRVAVGFVATTAFTSLLLLTTVLHWDRFNYGHVSFWAWLLLYTATPFLLPILWWKNQRTDPRVCAPKDVQVPRGLRVTVGVGGGMQLGVALVIFVWPSTVIDDWPWQLTPATTRSLSAFIAFPAMTWLWFLFESRWSSFRATQETAILGLVLVAVGALRARGEFHDGWQSSLYTLTLAVVLVLNVVLYVAMERRAKGRAAPAHTNAKT